MEIFFTSGNRHWAESVGISVVHLDQVPCHQTPLGRTLSTVLRVDEHCRQSECPERWSISSKIYM